MHAAPSSAPRSGARRQWGSRVGVTLRCCSGRSPPLLPAAPLPSPLALHLGALHGLTRRGGAAPSLSLWDRVTPPGVCHAAAGLLLAVSRCVRTWRRPTATGPTPRGSVCGSESIALERQTVLKWRIIGCPVARTAAACVAATLSPGSAQNARRASHFDDVSREALFSGPFRAMPGDVAMHPSLDELHRVHLKRTADLFGDAAQRPEPDEARRVLASETSVPGRRVATGDGRPAPGPQSGTQRVLLAQSGAAGERNGPL